MQGNNKSLSHHERRYHQQQQVFLRLLWYSDKIKEAIRTNLCIQKESYRQRPLSHLKICNPHYVAAKHYYSTPPECSTYFKHPSKNYQDTSNFLLITTQDSLTDVSDLLSKVHCSYYSLGRRTHMYIPLQTVYINVSIKSQKNNDHVSIYSCALK